ncbi:MAG: hypothetical protein JNM47_08820 [Hyphomonadaceae bacterium]|nr:hypothetical protein [Hyphomonadaceae bacterium]
MSQPALSPKAHGGAEVFECARAFLGIARELYNASSVCMGLEGHVAHLLANYAGEDRALLIRELQHIDTLNQLLVALSSYASVLGSQCISGATLDIDGASREMGLARVSERLRAIESNNPVTSSDRGSSGDLDML